MKLDSDYIPSLEECLKHADETKELILKKDALESIPALLNSFFPSNTGVYLVSDENTEKAAGNKTREILEGAGIKIAGSYIFPGEPRLHAEYSHINFLKNQLNSLDDHKNLVPVSIGAGTINDLVKRTSSELDIRYLCVPTASSVDGYTPNGAALLMDGFKQTLPCPAPKVLAADIDVIANAPAYLASSGFGDLASKIIAGTDWIIAETAGTAGAMEAPAIDKTAWVMTQNGLYNALNKSINASRGDREAIKTLFEALSITGFAMQYYKNARPVSGSEHLFSHVWEMEDLSVNGAPVTHGYKAAIGTLAATAFTEIFFADSSGPPAVLKSWKRPSKDERKAEAEAAFKKLRACDRLVQTALEKTTDEKTADAINQVFRDSWKEIRSRVMERLLPYRELRDLLASAECLYKPESIGLSRNEVIGTAKKAQMMRKKYTVLDLAWDLGCFENILSQMESSGIYLY